MITPHMNQKHIRSLGVLYICAIFASLSLSAQAQSAPQFSLAWGNDISDVNALQRPKGLKVSQDGAVYVTDLSNRLVKKYSQNGEHLATLESSFVTPIDVVLDASGNVLISDNRSFKIKKFDNTLSHLSDFSVPGADYMDIDSQGRVYVSLQGRSFKVLDSSSGAELSSFTFPTATTVGIAVYEGKNRCFIYSTVRELKLVDGVRVLESRIEKNDCETGAPLETLVGPGILNGAEGITVDSKGNLFVADRGNHRVCAFNSDGVLLYSFGQYGFGDGQFNQPSDVAIGPDGDVYVVDSGNNRVQKWSFPVEENLTFGVQIESIGTLSLDSQSLRQSLQGQSQESNIRLNAQIDSAFVTPDLTPMDWVILAMDSTVVFEGLVSEFKFEGDHQLSLNNNRFDIKINQNVLRFEAKDQTPATLSLSEDVVVTLIVGHRMGQGSLTLNQHPAQSNNSSGRSR